MLGHAIDIIRLKNSSTIHLRLVFLCQIIGFFRKDKILTYYIFGISGKNWLCNS